MKTLDNCEKLREYTERQLQIFELDRKILESYGTPRHEPQTTKEERLQLVEKKKELEKQNHNIVPRKSILPIDRVVLKAADAINAGSDVVWNPKENDERKRITIPILPETYELPERVTPFDMVVHNAVCTLLESGRTVFTPAEIYRAMNGMTNCEYVKMTAIEHICRSVEKMRVILLTIDRTEMIEKADGLEELKVTVENYMLPVKKYMFHFKNSDVAGYALLDIPPLLEHSKSLNRVRTLPIELLNTKKLRSSKEIIIVKNYLLTQIELMKPKKGRSNVILYRTLFDECGIDSQNPTITKRYRGYIEKMLEQWKEQGYITGYKQKKKGRAIDGIEIFFRKD